MIFAVFVLRPEELRVLRRHRFLHLTALSGLALGALYFLGAQIFFSSMVAWLIGAITFGFVCLETGVKIRRAYWSRSSSLAA